MRIVAETSYSENQNMSLMFNDFFFLNRAIYEIMWKDAVEPDRPQVTIQYSMLDK